MGVEELDEVVALFTLASEEAGELEVLWPIVAFPG